MNRQNREIQDRNQKASPAETAGEQDIRINGLEQVIEMLRHADPSFRASLIRRLQARDPALARRLLQFIR
jgi:hypothetical protein